MSKKRRKEKRLGVGSRPAGYNEISRVLRDAKVQFLDSAGEGETVPGRAINDPVFDQVIAWAMVEFGTDVLGALDSIALASFRLGMLYERFKQKGSARPPGQDDDRHTAGGFYCQNCSRVLVEKQGAICSPCLEDFKRSTKQ